MPNSSGYYSYSDFFRGQVDPNYQGQARSFGGGIPSRFSLPRPQDMNFNSINQPDQYFPEGLPTQPMMGQPAQEELIDERI